MSSGAASTDLIARPGPWAVPFEYELGATEVVTPTTAFARFDGSAASGDFVPCLAFYAQDGTLLSRVFPSTTLAPGDVANVSYAPFPGGIAGTSTGTGDYVFVQEAAPAASAFTFSGIPQDARHLVLDMTFRFASQVPIIQFNGDAGANYKTLYQTVQDLGGVVTDTSSSTTPTQTGIYLMGMDTEYPARAVITIPYYRHEYGFGFRDRAILADIEGHTDNAGSGIHLIRRQNLTGYWNPSPGAAAPAITSIVVSIAGAGGRCTLYKVI